jgi:glycosyltransferase involved in cell wall biosynthesis
MSPRLSIGMPVYNAEPWLADAIEALRQQTFRDFELIVSDNASSDGSPRILAELANTDARIRVLRQDRNIGANGNYRAVLAAARGDLFKWASANDLCAPRFLEVCVRSLDGDPGAVLSYPRTLLFDTSTADGALYEHDFELRSDDRARRFVDLLSTIRLNNAMNGVIRREALLRSLPMGNFRSADILLMAELALLGKFVFVDEPLFFRRMSPEAATSKRGIVEADQHLVPSATRPLLWQHWRYQLRLLRIVGRAAPYDASWWRIVRHAFRRISWARSQLAFDVNNAVARVAKGSISVDSRRSHKA